MSEHNKPPVNVLGKCIPCSLKCWGRGRCKCDCHRDLPFFLEAIITCVGQSDFLAHTLSHNRTLFDKILVVTAPEDKETQRVCRYWQTEAHLTDAFRTRWGEFCKGNAINDALPKLALSDWLIHLDCDILLPPEARTVIKNAQLDKSMLYGIDRLEFKSYERFQQFYGNPQLHTDGGANNFVSPSHAGDDVRVGTRVTFGHMGGYIPIGFFQLWNPAHTGIVKYADGHTDASREDNVFATQWPRAKRGFLPELIGYHLESEDAPMAVNWRGRKTKPFAVKR